MWRDSLFPAGLLAATMVIGHCSAANAETQTLTMKPVLELFTSQGCSSCPPADALLKTYIDGHRAIGLSMPVDYWDYLGWKDSLASPKFSERQRDYAKSRGDNMVYTPQIVVNGITHVVGSHEGEIEQAIQDTEKKIRHMQVPLRAWTENGKLEVEAGDARGNGHDDATLWIAIMRPSVEVVIQRGENSGRTVTYSNVVREWSQLGTWSGKKVVFERDLTSMREGTTCAVLLQVGSSGPIIAAAEIDNIGTAPERAAVRPGAPK
jgi:hypothetical protein